MGRKLAARIPASEYPAPIPAVRNYCCLNFCRSCKGARLHECFVLVKGFKPIPKNKSYLITIGEYRHPKQEHCQWRLSKRRACGEDGNMQPISWLGRCISCSDKDRQYTVAKNAREKEKRQRIKRVELQYLRNNKQVQVNRTHTCTLAITQTFIYL